MNGGPIKVTPEQMMVLLLLDNALAHLQTVANQIGGFLKNDAAGLVVVEGLKAIGAGKERLMREWQSAIVVVPANGAIVEGTRG